MTAGMYHSCALLTGGSVVCWGHNNRGQLGDGTYTVWSTPTTVVELAGATAVAAGESHTCAIVSGGAVRCWGDNLLGQLGLDPVMASTAVPVTIGF